MGEQPLFWEVLETRRSIRKYKPDPVQRELIDRVLAAGVQAPNARNRQSWRFVVLTGQDEITRLADALNENFRRDMLAAGKLVDEVNTMVTNRKARICAAPVVVVLFVEVADLSNYSIEDLASPEYLMAVQSAALAGGQMLLAAQALGLGGLWMGGPLYAQQPIKDALELSATWLAQGMLLIGHADEAPEKKERKPMESVVKFI